MQITPPTARVSFEVTALAAEVEELAQDAHGCLMANASSTEPIYSDAFIKLMKVLELLPQQFS